jgi:dipeptidyl aminopeptidase/acylaminoacyl peptidase
MKNVLVTCLVLLSLAGQILAQTTPKSLDGSWHGTLEAGTTKLRLILTVTKAEGGTYAGRLESLDQGATIPLDTITNAGDAVRFEVKGAGIVFDGRLNNERTELTGKFMQGGQTIPLTLKRSDQASAAPPTSKPDYSAPAGAPYTAEDVSVKTPAGHTLAGTLTLPNGASSARRVAAVITISGSGRQDRDSALGFQGYRPFRQIADALARRGIAVLRMDDRGTGASDGAFKGATSADFGEDARAGLAYLRTRPEIRADRLGVIGHSEGAVIAPMVAEKEANLRAIVLLAGVAEPARSALHFQIKNQYDHDAKLTPERRAELIAAIPQRMEGMMAADPWMKYFLTYDPAAAMRRVSTPVLILTGANDKQAVPEQVALQEAAFRQGGNQDVTARVLPGLNHLFVEDSDGFPGNYSKLPPPVMMRNDVLEIITDWLATRLR